jgi:hypothetical protein
MLKPEIPKQFQNEEWIHLPKPSQRLMGLTRTTLLEIVLDPESRVPSAVIRKKHAQRGIRLIHRPSLMAHFRRLASLEVATNPAEITTPIQTAQFDTPGRGMSSEEI